MTALLLVVGLFTAFLLRALFLGRKKGWRFEAFANDDEGKPVWARGRTKAEAAKRVLAIIDRRHDERVAKGWAE